MLDYWWPLRDGAGLLLIESRSPEDDEAFYQVNAPAQTLSLGVSLLEAAPLVDAADPVLAQLMRERGRVYVDAFFKAPHDLKDGVRVLTSVPRQNVSGSCGQGVSFSHALLPAIRWIYESKIMMIP